MEFKINNHIINVKDNKVNVMRIDGKVKTIEMDIDDTTTFRDAITRIANITNLDTDMFTLLATQVEYYYAVHSTNRVVYIKTFKTFSAVVALYPMANLIEEIEYTNSHFWRFI